MQTRLPIALVTPGLVEEQQLKEDAVVMEQAIKMYSDAA